MKESNAMRRIMLAVSAAGSRVFRNNTGMGWVGEIINQSSSAITLRNPRPLHAGLCKGSSDLIGWTPVTITPDMVGRTVAVFTAIETKSRHGRASDDQIIFVDAIRRAGGIAGVAFNEGQAVALIKNWKAGK